MRMTLVSCVIACGLTSPALAGERSGVSSRPLAFAALIKDPAGRRVPASASDTSLPQRFMLPAGSARLERLPEAPLRGEGGQVAPGAPAWNRGSTLPDVTARAGGSYAVHDILRDQPRPRHRKSPLSAAFVLKLDGNDESPAFSVGGGGVAAAVWQAVPK